MYVPKSYLATVDPQSNPFDEKYLGNPFSKDFSATRSTTPQEWEAGGFAQFCMRYRDPRRMYRGEHRQFRILFTNFFTSQEAHVESVTPVGEIKKTPENYAAPDVSQAEECSLWSDSHPAPEGSKFGSVFLVKMVIPMSLGEFAAPHTSPTYTMKLKYDGVRKYLTLWRSFAKVKYVSEAGSVVTKEIHVKPASNTAWIGRSIHELFQAWKDLKHVTKKTWTSVSRPFRPSAYRTEPKVVDASDLV